MYAFLVQEFIKLRQGRMLSIADYSNTTSVISELAVFLKEHRARNTIVTDNILMNPGQPRKGSIKILNEEPGVRKEDIVVHIGIRPHLTIRVSDAALGKWCKLRGIQKPNLTEALKLKLGARIGGARLASGTAYAVATEQCWTFPVIGTPLEHEVEYVQHYKP
jgi:hypothetical protein